MGRETMDEDDETEVNARRTSSPPAPYDEPPPAQLDDSFVATFRQCKPPNPTPIREKWIPDYEGCVLNYTGKSDYMFGDITKQALKNLSGGKDAKRCVSVCHLSSSIDGEVGQDRGAKKTNWLELDFFDDNH